MIVLIVGPSGIGKSQACKAAEKHFSDSNVVFADLDELVGVWGFNGSLIAKNEAQLLREKTADDNLFLGLGLFLIGKLESEYPKRHLVVDVGAGFQAASAAKALHRIFHVIAITATPDVAHERIKTDRGDARSIEDYESDEYRSDRVAVYESANHTIETSMQDETATCEEFVNVLRSILDNAT
jgi:shikimate kinase